MEQAAASDAKPLEQPRTTPAIEQFIQGIESGSWRRPILVIVDDTQFGKSALGRQVLHCIAKKLHMPSFLEVTMEEAAVLDFSDLRVQEHGGVLLDGTGAVSTAQADISLYQNQAVWQLALVVHPKLDSCTELLLLIIRRTSSRKQSQHPGKLILVEILWLEVEGIQGHRAQKAVKLSDCCASLCEATICSVE